MSNPETDIHFKEVADWFKKAGKDLSPVEQVHLLEKAILAIEKRAGLTLSHITLMVVLDRILHQIQLKHPILESITLQKQYLDFSKLDKHQNAPETILALTIFLEEILRVIGRLTANILNKSLHNELKKVSSNDSGES